MTDQLPASHVEADDWTLQHAPRRGEWIHTRDPRTGDPVTDHAFEVIENYGSVPGARLAPGMPWKTYWEVLVQCPIRCGCEGTVTDQGKCRHLLLLAADEFIRNRRHS